MGYGGRENLMGRGKWPTISTIASWAGRLQYKPGVEIGAGEGRWPVFEIDDCCSQCN